MKILGWASLLSLLAAGAATPTFAEPPAPPAVTHGDPGCLPRASDGGSEPDRDAIRAAGVKVADQMIKGLLAPRPVTPDSPNVTPDMGTLVVDGAFGGLWARCGLTRRERSLVTLGILMALRASGELEYHFRIARANGLAPREIDEAIYQAAGYAGFPAAANAREVYAKVVKQDASPAKK